VPYVLLSDRLFEGHTPVIEYTSGRKVPHYCYARTAKSSRRALYNRPAPFRYNRIRPERLTKKSKVAIVETDGPRMNFLKDVYLAKSIQHSIGAANFLVYVDDMLVGGLIYSLPKYGAYGPGAIYLLSDVTLTREGKLSKLVAMLATSQQILDVVGRKIVNRLDFVVTTARTHKPVSMKYRGIYRLLSRRPSEDKSEGNVIQYGAESRPETPQEIYADWWRRYGKESVGQYRDRVAAGRPEDPKAA